MFGESESVPNYEISNSLMTLLRIEDSLLVSKELRNVVLVGHGLQTELAIFARIGLDIVNIAPVVGIVDTPKIAEYMYGKGSYSLKILLDGMGCPAKNLHNAGDDSNYALRILLMLSVHSCRADLFEVESLASLLPKLQEIAQAPLPDVSLRNEKARALRGRFGLGEWSDALESHFPCLDATFQWD